MSDISLSQSDRHITNSQAISQTTADVPCPPPLANSRVSAQRSPGWGGGGDGCQVTVSRGGGGCKGISRQTVVPSTDASKENTCEATFWYRTQSPGENILGLKQQHNTPIQRLWRENITEHTQVLDLK